MRFGYDPCKTPEAKKYQVLDFRIRCSTKHGEEWGQGGGLVQSNLEGQFNPTALVNHALFYETMFSPL